MPTPTGFFVLATLVLAQAGRPPLLAGPRVSREAATQGESVFSAAARPRPAPIGPHRWLRLLRQIELDASQRAAIREIIDEFRRAREAFRAEHGDRLETLSREAKAAREADRVLPERQRLQRRDLRAKHPKGADYLKRIWAVLDASQQQRMRELLAEARRARAGPPKDDSQRTDNRPVAPRP